MTGRRTEESLEKTPLCCHRSKDNIYNYSNLRLDTSLVGSVTSAPMFNTVGSMSGGGYGGGGGITNWGGPRVLPLGGFWGTCRPLPTGESMGIHSLLSLARQ